jgi:hypothetical protein
MRYRVAGQDVDTTALLGSHTQVQRQDQQVPGICVPMP